MCCFAAVWSSFVSEQDCDMAALISCGALYNSILTYLGRGYSTFPQPIGSLPSAILSVLSLLAAITAAAALPEGDRKHTPDSRHSHAHSSNIKS